MQVDKAKKKSFDVKYKLRAVTNLEHQSNSAKKTNFFKNLQKIASKIASKLTKKTIRLSLNLIYQQK